MNNSNLRHVELCGMCRGAGEILGATMRIYCPKCDGMGFVSPGHETLQKMDVCRELYRQMELHNSKPQSDTAGRYIANTSGAGGSNYVGD